ncbi:D-alanyl-D-alanine carboxypeptidase / D-alanyl-D-alanine-endopeptidase (penicillin-binding protein 4) [Pedococcus dokdonensis]|uniref:D-alanyl-D-alanine carboxypeptidase / D-alanyl-D-alanine-endopeptidase (Penicillin-binding protein 4) n=1 Tax=Pedococcus dokdonensis TaxID=443156 RepID=A0A1H0SIL3_9MICO|nr:D-alanyl-D-alanine carboxypeptidase/D-alanyl-D-alanine-endopeptidase [Pedococcus dokdonensis]SDP41557.1 D-alanyl-D-alanine carboxypeptidase / D-alanyl-D-alanine-endopeptidase (penicillin-binding protein 4) [Pedococcus dokdonensis]
MTTRARTLLTTTAVASLAATALVAPTATAAPSALAPVKAASSTAAAVAPSLATAYEPSSADARIVSKLTARVTTARFGTQFSGAVMDARTGKLLWSKNGNTALKPASTIKFVAATNALRVFGPTYRFTTTVRRGTQADQVVLIGSGDPALSSTQLVALAKQTAAAMKAKGQLRVRLYADDTLFAAPTLATGWPSTYVPDETPWLRALVVDGRQVSDTTIDAAKIFAAKLKTYGITVASVTRGKASTANPVLATSAGQTIDQIVTRMMMESDNEHAEALHRLVGIKKGKGNTWTAARTAAQSGLTYEGLAATAIYDGSGLSRSDRLTSIQLAKMVKNTFEPLNKVPFRILRSSPGLPQAGRTGTLRASYDRFTASTSKCAAGKVYAKTGTLKDAVALAGWTVGKDGRIKAFAFIINGNPTSVTAMRQNIDMLAATVNGCY